MSQPPVNKVTQSVGYLWNLFQHTFWNPNAPPNLDEEENLDGKTVIVTGSNTGIGFETALQLAKRNATVVMACRDVDKAETAKAKILDSFPTAKMEVMKLDLGDLSSIREFVNEFKSRHNQLHILVNNAGLMVTDGERHETKDGFEVHMGINHLGPLLLTILLIPSLRSGAPSRIVCVSSSQIVLSKLNMEDLMMVQKYRTGFDGTEPYNLSKLASALAVKVLAARLKENGDKIKVYQLCPGFVCSDVFRNDQGIGGAMRKLMLKTIGVGPELGCETVVFCAVNRGLYQEGYGNGEMYRFRKGYAQGSNYISEEDPVALQLFDVSKNLIGIGSDKDFLTFTIPNRSAVKESVSISQHPTPISIDH